VESIFICPLSGLGLRFCSIAEAEALAGGTLRPGRNGRPAAIGRTQTVLFRDDRRCAYPVVDSIPILLAPERLSVDWSEPAPDIRAAEYAEAYEEMEFYNEVASREAEHIAESDSYKAISGILGKARTSRGEFPFPVNIWLDAAYDSGAQLDAYRALGPLAGKRVLQLGGKGIHAVKFLLAGAREAWVVSPMIGEARCAQALAQTAEVSDRLFCAVGIGEQLPFVAETFDAIYSGGCLHHMLVDRVFAAASRILVRGGRFAAVDPWRAPLYAFGTRILGKREPSVKCRPLMNGRVAGFREHFASAHIVQHGTLTRYCLLGLKKFGVNTPLSSALAINRVDNAICDWIHLRRFGSSAALCAVK
jgi:uncharacterized protein YbaR (Trm112 family)